MIRQFIIIAALGLAACGGAEAPPPAPEPAPAPAPAPEPEPAPAAASIFGEDGLVGTAAVKDEGQEAAVVELEAVGNEMKYDKDTLEAPAGLIRIKLKNNADSAAMKHNVVIVKKGTMDKVGKAGVMAGEAKGYVPDDENIFVATALSGPGETVSALVKLEAGEYEYICTFPGHYMLMKGTLVVK